MFQFNQAVFVGRLAKDPELKRLSDNLSKLNFILAVGRTYKKKDGVSTDFIPVVIWGKAAEVAFKLLRKGSPVLVSGRMQVYAYEKDQEERWTTELVADTFQLLEKLSVEEESQKVLSNAE